MTGYDFAHAQNITKSKIDLVRLRPIIYPNTDVFLVCFNITNPDSYNNVREKWVPEIKRYCFSRADIRFRTQNLSFKMTKTYHWLRIG